MADGLKSDTEGVFKPYYQQNQRIGPPLTALGLLRANTLAQLRLLLFYRDLISKCNCLLDLIVDLTNSSCAKVELDCSSSPSKQLLRMPSQRSYVSAKKISKPQFFNSSKWDMFLSSSMLICRMEIITSFSVGKPLARFQEHSSSQYLASIIFYREENLRRVKMKEKPVFLAFWENKSIFNKISRKIN